MNRRCATRPALRSKVQPPTPVGLPCPSATRRTETLDRSGYQAGSRRVKPHVQWPTSAATARPIVLNSAPSRSGGAARPQAGEHVGGRTGRRGGGGGGQGGNG